MKEKRNPKNDRSDPFPSRLRELLGVNDEDVDKDKSRGKFKELAQKIGVTTSAISNYAKGTTGVKVDNLIRIANYYHVSADWLLGLQEVRSKNPDEKMIAEYTGLSDVSIGALHTLKHGKTIIDKVKQVVDEDVSLVDEFIQVEPNLNALTALNKLIEWSPFSEDSEDENSEADWYSVAPEAMSFFSAIYEMLFPQEETDAKIQIQHGEIPDFGYVLYKAESFFRREIEGLREEMNPAFGKDGTKLKLQLLEERQTRQFQEWDEKLRNTKELLTQVKANLNDNAEEEQK